MADESTLTVVARRRYSESRERIFEAFTRSAQLARWFSPSDDIATAVHAFNLWVGGNYRLGFRFPDGKENYVTGAFREITPPERLVLTWSWEAPDPHAGVETLVTIELVEYGPETEVVVTHEWFPSQETHRRHEEGWSGALGRLAEFLI